MIGINIGGGDLGGESTTQGSTNKAGDAKCIFYHFYQHFILYSGNSVNAVDSCYKIPLLVLLCPESLNSGVYESVYETE